MKKIVILLFVACALLVFSCNKYCNCKHYIDGKVDKEYKKNSRFVNESGKDCADFNEPLVTRDSVTYELKCK